MELVCNRNKLSRFFVDLRHLMVVFLTNTTTPTHDFALHCEETYVVS